MNIDDFKRDFKKQHSHHHQRQLSALERNNAERLMNGITQMDREDIIYLFKHRFIPLTAGLVAMIIMLPLAISMKNISLLIGVLLITLTLATVLILYYWDYRQITREPFAASMADFLSHKEQRFKSWKSTRMGYHLLFILYQIGLLIMILANEAFLRKFSAFQLIMFLAAIYAIIFICWILGERHYRKRHQQEHQPLIKMIEELKTELSGERTE
jgi:hypothetical protein